MGVLPSFGVTVLSSAVWEELGELREHVAFNDMIVTPVSALPLGESMLQLGAFLHRGRRTPALVALGWLFAPWKSAHDAVDGLTPQGAYVVDDLGLAADVWHRFVLGASAGLNAQERGLRSHDARFVFHTDLVTVPGYHRDGKRSSTFGAGEVTGTRFQLGTSRGEVVDLDFAARAVPVGWLWQDVDLGADGRLRGNEVLAGLHVSAEYTLHDYDRDRRRPGDRLGLVAVGATVEDTVHAGPIKLGGRLDVLGDFAGVDAYALPEYQRARAPEARDAGLTSVLRNQHYYHAFGATVRPHLDVTVDRVDAGAEVRFDAFRGIEHVDVDGPLAGEVVAVDRRVSARAWLGLMPWRHLRFSLAGERNERSGSLAGAHASRSEVAAHLGGELVF